MVETGYVRKIDEASRLTIPAPMRKELNLGPNEVFHFHTVVDNGKLYLCIPLPDECLESSAFYVQKAIAEAQK